MVAGRGGAFQIGHVLTPAAIILGLGDHALFTQLVEKVEQRRARGQKARRQAGQVDQRGVEQLQVPLTVKDRKPDRQVGKGLGQGLHELAQAAFGAHGGIGGQGEHHHLVAHPVAVAIIPGHDAVILERGAAGRGAGAGNGLRRVQKARQGPAQNAVGPSLGPAQIGGVGPGDPLVLVLAPDQHRCLVQRAAQQVQLFLHCVERHRIDHDAGMFGLGVGHGQAPHPVAQILGHQPQGRAAPPLGPGHLDPAKPFKLTHPGGRLGEAGTKPLLKPRPVVARRADPVQKPARGGRGVDQAGLAEQEHHRLDRRIQMVAPPGAWVAAQARDIPQPDRRHRQNDGQRSCQNCRGDQTDPFAQHHQPPCLLHSALRQMLHSLLKNGLSDQLSICGFSARASRSSARMRSSGQRTDTMAPGPPFPKLSRAPDRSSSVLAMKRPRPIPS